MASAASIDSPTTFGTVTVRPWQAALACGDGRVEVPGAICGDAPPTVPVEQPMMTAVSASVRSSK